MDKKNVFKGKCRLSKIDLNDPENNEIRFVINGIEYLGKIPESKISLIHEIIKNRIEKHCVSIHILNDEILKEIKKLPLEKNKNYEGRKAKWIARQFNICQATIYQAQRVLRDAPPDIIKKVRSGKMPFKTAYKLITNKNPRGTNK